jgi:hypothetical protein
MFNRTTKLVRQKDFPAKIAARRLGLPTSKFLELLPILCERGFPAADPTTGNFDIDAIDEWRRSRYPHLFPTAVEFARDARAVVPDRLKRLGNEEER